MRKKTLILLFTFLLFFSKGYSLDIYDSNEQERMKEIDKEIAKTAMDIALDIGVISGSYMTGNLIIASLSGYRAMYDVNELIDLIKEKISLTKDEKEKRELQMAIDKLNSENSMDGYRENHSDEHSSIGDSDRVGGLGN